LPKVELGDAAALVALEAEVDPPATDHQRTVGGGRQQTSETVEVELALTVYDDQRRYRLEPRLRRAGIRGGSSALLGELVTADDVVALLFGELHQRGLVDRMRSLAEHELEHPADQRIDRKVAVVGPRDDDELVLREQRDPVGEAADEAVVRVGASAVLLPDFPSVGVALLLWAEQGLGGGRLQHPPVEEGGPPRGEVRSCRAYAAGGKAVGHVRVLVIELQALRVAHRETGQLVLAVPRGRVAGVLQAGGGDDLSGEKLPIGRSRCGFDDSAEQRVP